MNEKVSKVRNNGSTTISKYAAKKLANASKVESTDVESSPVKEEQKTNPVADTNKINKRVKTKGLPNVTSNFPEHVVYLALLIKNNAEIRRFTALGILNYLTQKNIISDGKKYVSFKWNKFAVSVNGLVREYSYTEQFFLNSLVAAFSSFSASAQRTIDIFCNKEIGANISNSVDKDEIENIVNLNEQYQSSEDCVQD